MRVIKTVCLLFFYTQKSRSFTEIVADWDFLNNPLYFLLLLLLLTDYILT